MENVCVFSMGIVGKKEDIDIFLDMLSQRGSTWIGAGAKFETSEFEWKDLDDESGVETWYAKIDGEVKRSLKSALFTSVLSMRENPEKWNPEGTAANLRFIPLTDACQELNLNVECYSANLDAGFSEHCSVQNGKLIIEDVIYRRVCDKETGEWKTQGGFPNWDFNLLLNDFDLNIER